MVIHTIVLINIQYHLGINVIGCTANPYQCQTQVNKTWVENRPPRRLPTQKGIQSRTQQGVCLVSLVGKSCDTQTVDSTSCTLIGSCVVALGCDYATRTEQWRNMASAVSILTIIGNDPSGTCPLTCFFMIEVSRMALSAANNICIH